ncbi:hypothetical protein GS676_04940 [Rhodococcus hoagii]|nr:hypothetical protein [Prescottella equi]
MSLIVDPEELGGPIRRIYVEYSAKFNFILAGSGGVITTLAGYMVEPWHRVVTCGIAFFALGFVAYQAANIVADSHQKEVANLKVESGAVERALKRDVSTLENKLVMERRRQIEGSLDDLVRSEFAEELKRWSGWAVQVFGASDSGEADSVLATCASEPRMKDEVIRTGKTGPATPHAGSSSTEFPITYYGFHSFVGQTNQKLIVVLYIFSEGAVDVGFLDSIGKRLGDSIGASRVAGLVIRFVE